MDNTEALQILAILKAAYPNSYRGMTQDDALSTAAVWAMQFADMPVDIVMMAINKAISSNPFPPSVAEVKEKMQKLYWEADYMLQHSRFPAEGPQQIKAQYERVRDVTRKYKAHVETCEPSVRDMLPAVQRMRLGGGQNTS